ncbi:HtaA domain-containing protein [Streptomyces sp. NPDC059837]|uniref:HtaA domain-containing protein n=1 Tax=Streptomyces sp. NPDC059837 TaxID=3346968 RepID=UPI00364E8CA5
MNTSAGGPSAATRPAHRIATRCAYATASPRSCNTTTQATGNGAFTFPDASGTYDTDADTLSAPCAGAVNFKGHEDNGSYGLDLTLSGLTAELDGGSAGSSGTSGTTGGTTGATGSTTGGVSGALASTGSEVPLGALGAAAAVTVAAGAGVVVAVRRRRTA